VEKKIRKKKDLARTGEVRIQHGGVMKSWLRSVPLDKTMCEALSRKKRRTGRNQEERGVLPQEKGDLRARIYIKNLRKKTVNSEMLRKPRRRAKEKGLRVCWGGRKLKEEKKPSVKRNFESCNLVVIAKRPIIQTYPNRIFM